MNWEDMLNMGFRQDAGMPTPENAFIGQMVDMMKATGIANANGLSAMMGRLLSLFEEMGYGINLAVSPDGDQYGLMIVELNPDRARETLSPDHPNVDHALIASFGPGTVDRMSEHVARIRNGEFK